MPEYKSIDEAINFHLKSYRSDGDAKGIYRDFHRHHYRVQALLNAIPHSSYVLDIGCNTGGFASRLIRERGCFVKGIDIVPELVIVAKQKGIFAQVGKAEKLPFRDNEFEVVVIAETLEHLFDPSLAIKEALRVLKPNGILTGSVPHHKGEYEKHRLDYEKLSERYHARTFTKRDLRKLLKDLGKLEIKDIPYYIDYCQQANIPVKRTQWHFFKGIK